jgi:hypothetical protein
MKSKLLLLGLFLAVLIFASPPTTKAGTNLLTNPSFEIDANGDNWPDDWSEWGSGDTQEPIDDPAQAHDGNISWRQEVNNGYALAWPENTPVTPGEVYVFAAYVKDLFPDGSPSTEPRFKIEFFAGGVRDDGLTYELAFPIDHDGEYHMIYHEIECPSGIDAIRSIIVTIGPGEYLWDSIWFGYGMPGVEGGATQPVPEDGSSVANDLTELSWTNPEQASPSEIITCNVWFSDNFPEYGKFDGDPNFTDYATLIVDNQPGNTASLTAVPPLEMDHVYYWRVDVHDPNKSEGPDDFVIGEVWIFDTFNHAPEVDAGTKQKAWLTETNVDVQIDATVTDDGMPLDPGTVTLKWTVESSPSTPTFSNDEVEDPIVTFDTAGRYILKLTADDFILSTYDTVIVDVYPGDYTGLVAHWHLDEESGPTAFDSAGGHDGTLMDDPTWMPSDGQVGGAIELDGNGDYIEILDSSDGADPMNTTWADFTEEVTVSCWIKVNEFTSDWQAIVCKGNTSYRMQRNWGDDSIWFAISDAGVGGTISVNDRKWHQVTATYDGETISLFIDGYPDGSVENTDGIVIDESSLTIGENIGYPRTFNGLIDEVRIYEIGLPADRVLADFVNDGGYNSCGQVYKATDFNQDCYTNLLDFAELAAMWLECSDITEPSCL